MLKLFSEKNFNKNLLELNAQDIKLWKEKACFVIPATSFLTKSDTTCPSNIVESDIKTFCCRVRTGLKSTCVYRTVLKSP